MSGFHFHVCEGPTCYYPDACSERKESEGWASYAAEQERHAETARARDAHFEARNKLAEKIDHLESRLAEMTREARLSREAAEKAVRSRDARHEIERALRAVSLYDDVASDEDVLFHDGAAHAVRVIREMLELDE